jgi:hypothetical protein
MGIAGEEQIFRALTLLLAVCEQALAELEALAAPDHETRACIERLRNRLYAVLDYDPRHAKKEAEPSQRRRQ